MAILKKLGIQYISVELGEVNTKNIIKPSKRKMLYNELQQSGFELIDENENDLIEKLKMAIVELGHYSDKDLKTSYSDYLSLNVKDKFISLNILFIETKGITIEKYIIKYKIELVKKLLANKNLDLSEIANKMHYSSIAQLSGQFKSITGLTPTHFRELSNTKNYPSPDWN